MIAFWLFFADGRIYLSPIHGSVPISSSAFLAAYVSASFLATLQMVSFLRHLFLRAALTVSAHKCQAFP